MTSSISDHAWGRSVRVTGTVLIAAIAKMTMRGATSTPRSANHINTSAMNVSVPLSSARPVGPPAAYAMPICSSLSHS